MSSLSNDLPVLVLLGVFLLIGGLRSIRMARGAPANPARLFAYAGLWLFLFLLVAVAGVAPLPVWYLGLEGVLLVGAAVFATSYVRGVAKISRTPSGGWTYRLGVALPAVYLTLLIVRLSVDLAVLGENPFAGTPGAAPASVGTFTILLVGLVDALFAFSTGLLVGRSVGVYLALEDHQRREGTAAPVPPPSAPPLP